MSELLGIDPTTIKPFPRIHYHDGFDAFGIHVDGLGHNGHKPGPNGQKIFHQDETQQHQIGEVVKIPFSDEQFQVMDVAYLAEQEHKYGTSHPLKTGNVYLLKPVSSAA